MHVPIGPPQEPGEGDPIGLSPAVFPAPIPGEYGACGVLGTQFTEGKGLREAEPQCCSPGRFKGLRGCV